MPDLRNLPEKAAMNRAVDIDFVAEYRGVSSYEIRRLKRLGRIPAPLNTGGRRLFWKLGDIVAWVEGMSRKETAA